MAYEWPHYDPTLEALLHPERRHPFGLCDDTGWTEEAICAELARLAYFPFKGEGAERLPAALAKAGFGTLECWDSKVPTYGNWLARARQLLRDRGAQAFGAVARDGSLAIVAFRGTQPNQPMDLLVDLSFRAVSWSGAGRVHEGFLKAYQSLGGGIDAWLQSVRPRRVIVTGHSLGAAMATVMAALRPDARLVTFGSPLVGDADFVRTFEGRDVARYVDCADLVTTVPYEWLGYAHVGAMRYIDRSGVVHHPPTSAAVVEQDRAEAKRDYLGTFLRLGNAPSRDLADHGPVNYVSAVAGKRP
jgi:hypothetical protein